MAENLLCAHGYLLLQDACHGCAVEAKKPHKSDPVYVLSGHLAEFRCRLCGTAPGDGIHWTAENRPVDGPPRITVEQIENGVALDVTGFVTELVITLAQGGRFSDLCDIAELYETAAKHDGHAREELLVEELVERLATRIPQHGIQALGLADEIRRFAAPLVTQQIRGA